MRNRITKVIAAVSAFAAWHVFFAVAPLAAQDRPEGDFGALQTAVEYILDQEGWEEDISALASGPLSHQMAAQLTGRSGVVDCGTFEGRREPWFTCLFTKDRAAIELHDLDVQRDCAVVEARLWLQLSEEIDVPNNRGIFYSHWKLELTRAAEGEWEVSRVLSRASGG